MAVSSHHRRLINISLGVVVSVTALVWSLMGVEWHSVWKAIHSVRFWLIPFPFVVFWLHCLVRAYRWRYLLPAPHSAPLHDLFDGLVIGNLCTFLLPLRAGELVRPYIVSRRGQYTYPISLASVVIERFFDLSAVLISFGCIVSQFPSLPQWAYKGAQGLTVLAVLLLGFIVVGALWRSTVVGVVQWLVGLASETFGRRVAGFVDDLLRAGESLRSGGALVRVFAATFLVWGSTFAIFYLFILMLPSLPVSVVMSVSLTTIVALAVAAPSAPGFLGIYQAGCVGALDLFGVVNEDAVALALVSHAVQYLMALTFGCYCLRRQGVRWSDLREQVRDEESPLDVVELIETKPDEGV